MTRHLTPGTPGRVAWRASSACWCTLVRRGRGRDTGSVSVEMALLYTPLMVLVALTVVICVRIASTASDVNSAAAAAARQASIARNTSSAVAGARDAAAATLGARHIPCRPRTVRVDTAQMVAGGSVTVTVACKVSLADLSGLGLPGSITLRSMSRQVVDTYRGFQ